MEVLEELNIQTVNNIGIDINLLIDHEHWHNQLQFLSGLGPRKAQKYIQKLKSMGKPLYTRNEIIELKILRKNCFKNSLGFTKVRVPPNKRPDNFSYRILDQTRIHLIHYPHVHKIVVDCLHQGNPDVEDYRKEQGVVKLIQEPDELKKYIQGEYKEVV